MSFLEVIIASLVAGIIGAITAYLTSRWNLRNERTKWEHELNKERIKHEEQRTELRREFTMRLAELRITSPDVADAIAVQEAIAYVIVDDSSSERDKYFITPGEHLVVGRSSSAGIFVDANEFSRRHLEFFADQSEVHVRDFGSHNGVLVNGKRISDLACLNDGDIITASPPESCKVRLIFHRIDKSA